VTPILVPAAVGAGGTPASPPAAAILEERPDAGRPGAAAAPFVAAAADGGFLLAWEHRGEGEADIVACRREPGPSGTWGVARRVDTGEAGAARSLEPRVASLGAGGWIVAWQDAREGREAIRANRSTDGGRTWLPDDVAVCATNAAPQTMPAVAADGGGCAWVAWEDLRDGARDIRLSRSADLGATWERDRRVDSDAPGAGISYHPQVVVLDGGILLVCWWDERDGLADLYVRRSTDGGAGWAGPERRLDPGPKGASASRGAEVRVEGGTVVVEWDEEAARGDPASRRLACRTTDGGASWEPARDATTPEPVAAAAAVSPAGDSLLVRVVDGEIRASWRGSAGP
jgi:hypothetical protein